MNEHLEILIENKPDATKNAIKVVLWVLCAFSVITAVMGIIGFLAPIIFAVVAGIGAYFIGFRVNTEFEYVLMDKEIDVDIIFSKESRKHLATIELEKLEVAATLGDMSLDAYKGRDIKTFDYTSGLSDKKPYILYCADEKFVLDYCEELVNALYNIAPRKVNK